MEDKNPIISIIIPVYNVEKYLERCVNSLVNQTFKEIEILLVNDGSTDNSGALCDEFAKKYDNVRAIHKPNGGCGPSEARNMGLELAKGQYIGFIDSDDYVDEDMFEVLYNAIVKENADVSVCGLYHAYTDCVRTAEDTTGYYVVDSLEAMKMVLESKKISVNPVNKLYKASLFENMKFPVGKRSEDAHIMIRLLSNIDKAVVTMAPKYYYVHREGSITTQPYSSVDLSVIEAYEDNYNFVEQNYPELLEVATFRKYWAYFYVLDKMMLPNGEKDNKTKKEIISVLRKNKNTILENSYFGKSRKIAMRMLAIHISLYKLCIYAYNKKKRKLHS